MRIALALEYPLMQQGGTEVLVQELLRRLSRHFEIVLVSGDRLVGDLPEEFGSLICRHIAWDAWGATTEDARQLANKLKAEGIHLAHFHFGETYAWRSNRFWRCPVRRLAKLGIACVVTNHLVTEWLNSYIRQTRPAWQKQLLQLFALFNRAIALRNVKLEVCVSQHDQKRLQGQFPLGKGKIIQRYHSLLPADAPPPDLQNRDEVILCVGTIGGRKAQPNLAEAFARIAGQHSGWQLHLVGREGNPADVERIRATIARHGLNQRIHLLGRLDDAEALRRMQRASIIAMPSLQEGLGLSLQEALFHGCVGVGTRAGGIPELIEHEINGLLVPPGDIPALSAALDRLMSDRALLDKFRVQSRFSILRKGMTSVAMVQNYLDLYKRVLPVQRDA